MESRVCIVTGASSGIGAGIALSLVKAGFRNLVLVARRREMLETVAQECKEKGATEVMVLEKDLSNLETCTEIVKEVMDRFERIDVLVNNAGILEQALLCDTTVEQMQKVLNINLMSPFALTKNALPHIRKAKGNIVFISSVGGQRTGKKNGLYGTSKAGLNQMAKTFAVEEAKHGVRVNIVSPGAIFTDLFKGFLQDMTGQKLGDDMVKMVMTKSLQPLGVVGLPEHVGEAVAYLANGDVSGYTTGADVVVDGGAMLGLATGNQN